MKKYILTLFATLFVVGVVCAQTPMLYRGTGSGGNSIPWGNGFQNYIGAYIYAPGEFTGTSTAGTISKVYFRPNSSTGTTTLTNVVIKLSQTIGTNSTWVTSNFPNGTVVFSASSYTFSHTANSWCAFTLQTPFTYNPNLSLVFEAYCTGISGTGFIYNTTSQAGKRLYNSSYTATTGSSDTQWPDFGIDLLSYPNNIGVTGLASPTNTCGETSAPVVVNIYNFGANSITGFALTTQVTGALSATFTRPSFSRTIPPGGADTAIMGYLNTSTTTGVVNFKSFSAFAADTARSNDTNVTALTFLGSPPTPVFSANPVNVCGVAPIKISTQQMANTQTLWYPSSTSSTLLGQSDTLVTAPLVTPVTTYYAARARFSAATLNVGQIVQWSWYSTGYGYMVDITASATANVIIDSLTFLCVSGQNGTGDLSVYYKAGTHVGYQTTASAWTLGIKLTNYAPQAYPNNTTIPTGGIIIPAGATYGFYLQTGACAPYINNPVNTYANAEITLPPVNSTLPNGSFGSPVATNLYQPGFNFKYRKICVSNRLPIVINTSPRPTGSAIDATNPFKGTDNGGQTFATKDIVGEGDTAIYNIVTPTGYANGGYGSVWKISQITFTTMNGAAPAASDTLTTAPSVSGGGKFRFIPSAAYADSVMLLTMKIQSIATGCDSIIVRYIYVAPKPTANFSFTTACDGSAVKFTTASGIKAGQISHSWDFGDVGTDDISTTENPSYTYKGPGTYTVTLTVTSNFGYSKTITQTVNVAYTPVTDFAYNNVCLGLSTAFTNKTTVGGSPVTMNYSWDFDNTTSSTQTNPSLLYNTVGVYNVTLTTTTGPGCKSSKSKQVYVFPNPVANFSIGNSCSGFTTQFTNSSSIMYGSVGYTWYFGDGSFETTPAPGHGYASLGNYNVKLVAKSQFGCVDSITKPISVKSKPVADFTAPMACDGDFVNFTNASTLAGPGTLSSKWTFGDGNIQTNNNSSFGYQYGAKGTYTVKLTVTSSDNCVDSKEATVMVGERPAADFITSGPSCSGVNTNFTNKTVLNTGTLSYLWNYGSGSSNQQNGQFNFATAGSYDVWLVATSDLNCTDSVKHTIIVNPSPTISFTSPVVDPFAVSRQVQFTPSNTGMYSYSWDMGDGSHTQQVSPIYSYLGNGPYSVKLDVVDMNGCTASHTQTVFFRVSAGKVSTAGPVRVYPNPAVKSVTFETGSTLDKPELVLTNALGQKVQISGMQVQQDRVMLDLDGLPAGVYYLQLKDLGKTFTARFTKLD